MRERDAGSNIRLRNWLGSQRKNIIKWQELQEDVHASEATGCDGGRSIDRSMSTAVIEEYAGRPGDGGKRWRDERV